MLNVSNFFAENFVNFIWLAVFILALLPITESRIAFSFAINETLLKENVMSPFLAILTCFLASIFLTLFLLVFFKGVCKILYKFKVCKKIIDKVNIIIENKSKNLKNKNFKYLMLFLFVLIPLPLTGIWSAALISEFLNLDFKKSLIAIVLGNLGSIVLIYIFSLFFKDLTLPIILIIFILTLAFLFFRKLFKRKKF